MTLREGELLGRKGVQARKTGVTMLIKLIDTAISYMLVKE